MSNSTSKASLVTGCLAVGVALLSVAIVQTTGEWPTILGLWGALLFGGLGIIPLGMYMRTRTTGNQDT